MTQAIRTALVVDDSRMARATLAKLLDKRGITVEVAESGNGAVEHMDTHEHPDVVFMDYTMPDIDGIEAIRQIRERHGHSVPMAMYTSQEGDEEQQRAQQLGVTAFLMKPASDDRLADVLDQLDQASALPEASAEDLASNDDTPVEPEPVTPAEPAPSSIETAMGVSSTPAEDVATTDTADADDPGEVGSGLSEAATASQDAEHTAEAASASVASEEPPSRPAPSESESGPTDEAPSDEPAVRAVAEEAAIRVAEDKAREIAEAVVRNATDTIAEEASPAAADQALDQIRKDVASQVDNTLQSESFSHRVTQVFRETTWPEAREQIISEIAASLRDEMHRTARDAASELAGDRTEEAKSVARQIIGERESALRMQLNQDTERDINALESRLKRLILGVGAGLGVAMVAGFIALLVVG